MKFSTFKGLLAVSFLLMCGGCILGFWGNDERKLGEHSTADPTSVDLGRLEAGDKLENYHIVLGPHYACYDETIFSYREKKKATSKPGPSTKVEYALYPVVSKNPEDDDVDVEHFAVLVKTERFKTVGDIPDGSHREESVKGMVINEIRSLDTKEKNLIREAFPKVHLKKILILEEGRTPSSSTTSTAAIYGGVVFGILGVFGGIVFTLWFLIGLMTGKG